MATRNSHPAKSIFRFLRTSATLLILPLTVLLLSRQAFARNTYVINDGTRVFTYESFATDPLYVLTEAGLQLTAYDTYTTEAGIGTTTLTVQRNMTITLDYHGQTMTVSSGGETVSQLLARLNIFPDENDVVSAGLEQPVRDGMHLQVQQILQEEQTYTAIIPHETTYYYSDTLPEGTEQVMTEGKDGELLRTAQVTYVNGQETQRKVLSEIVTINPTAEVIALGTGLREDGLIRSGKLVIGDDTITLPTGEVLTYTGTTQVRASGYTHTDAGCDMITKTGTTVRTGTVAVDPRFIPYGTRMFIVSNDGSYIYGISVAEDCGGAIKGDRVDLYFPTTAECFQFGRRDCTVYFLG